MSAYPDACFITSAHRPEQFVRDEGAEIAVAGRFNAGKSSAINAIVNRKGFAHTSKSPGRTQLINFFSLGDRRRLVDLPGYGYARVARSVREHWRDLLEAYFKDRASLTGLILVVDSRRLLRDFDWQMLDWCRVIGCPVHVLLTKADKLKKAAASNALLSVRREVPENVSVQLFSALKGQGVEQARRRLDELLRGCGGQGAQKEASGAEYRGAPEAKSTGLG
jgi:GTP-binding protein